MEDSSVLYVHAGRSTGPGGVLEQSGAELCADV